ncbi:helix-turn-helix domain-containing protein [Oricola sp.]|uniref:helix-turn-helix domain-containing protein n=1 Tax=Oricola sp. TaxID=1979950 RepID=UPI003BAD89CB
MSERRSKRPSAGSAPFTSRKLLWLETVATDANLNHASVRVAAVLALRYLNSTSGQAFPSQSKLAADIGVTEITIRRALPPLVEAGYLTKKRGGSGRANRYKIAFPDAPELAAKRDHRPIKNERSKADADRSEMNGQDATSPINSDRRDRSHLYGVTDQNCTPNPHREPRTESQRRAHIEPASGEDSESIFDIEDSPNPYAIASGRHDDDIPF